MTTESTNNTDLTFEPFRNNLRSLIESKGIYAKELAYQTGTTPATISRYLTNMRDPELKYVYRLCKYFGVSIDWILGLSEDRYIPYTPEIQKIAELYSMASKEDQAVIQTVLRKYEGRCNGQDNKDA